MHKMPYKNVIIIAVIMVSTFVILTLTNHSENIKANKPFNSFPMIIGPWHGVTSRFDQKVYDILGVNDSILASYRSKTMGEVQLYVGFYQSQKEGDLIHSPKNCLPGSGWNIIRTSIEKIAVGSPAAPKSINVIKLILKQDDQEQVVLYWFQSRGRIISSEYMQKIWLVIDSITKHRTDGSFVRVIAPVVKNEDATVKIMKNFIRDIFPYLKEYIPS